MANYGYHSARNCVRCQRDLTDAASMEVGIGPICRKLDNAVLAQTIPADPAMALVALETVNAEVLAPETVKTFTEVVGAVAAGKSDDWRKPVKQMEWMLSYPQTRSAAFQPMLMAVQSLGYVGLAALWAGEASTGQTTVRFENGRLYVKGPQNKHARYALKGIVGWRFHGDTKEWSVPASHGDAFKKVVEKFYPVNVGMVDALNSAKAHTTLLPKTLAAPASTPAQHAHRVETVGDTLRVFTPYNANFVADLKSTLPYADRQWNTVSKCWVVAAKHANMVALLVEKHYNTVPVTANLTPKPVAAPAPVLGNTLPF